MSKKILLIGGGGHCRSVLDTLSELNSFDEIGIIDKSTDTTFTRKIIVGSDSDLPALFKNGWKYAFITVGSIGNTVLRRKLYQKAKKIGFEFPNIIDSSAIVSRNVQMGEGIFIGKRAVVNTDSIIGKCAIINTASVIEHNCSLGDFVHIAPGATICGGVTIGNDSHIGTGSSVRQQITIGEKCLIGVGSAVVSEIPDNSTAYGNPCKVKNK